VASVSFPVPFPPEDDKTRKNPKIFAGFEVPPQNALHFAAVPFRLVQ